MKFDGYRLRTLIENKVLREKRKHKEVRAEIRNLCGVTKQTLSGWESGNYTPATKNLHKLRSYFELYSTDQLFCEEEENESK